MIVFEKQIAQENKPLKIPFKEKAILYLTKISNQMLNRI
jgi:hypothetical protein